MNIVHVTAQRPDSTGSGVYLRETVMALREQGHVQAVVAGVGPSDSSPFPADVVFEPVRFETDELPFPVVGMSDVMPYRATRYRDLDSQMVSQFKAAFTRAFDRVFSAFRPDIVICHHLYLVCGVLMEWFAAHPDVRATCSVRGVSHNTDVRQFKSHGLERQFIRSGVNELDCAFALHDALARDIRKTYGIEASRVHVTGTGYNSRAFTPQWDLRDPDACQLLYVGKIWKQKGLLELAGALDRLPDALASRLRLDLVGGYSDEAERDEIVERFERCQVEARFLGTVDQDALVGAYRRSNAFVLPSFSEGLPLVAVEALACGCAVVITELPGVRDWFERYAPDAPMHYVALPRFVGDDPSAGPVSQDVEPFERALAETLERAVRSKPADPRLEQLSWGSLAVRLVQDYGGR